MEVIGSGSGKLKEGLADLDSSDAWRSIASVREKAQARRVEATGLQNFPCRFPERLEGLMRNGSLGSRMANVAVAVALLVLMGAAAAAPQAGAKPKQKPKPRPSCFAMIEQAGRGLRFSALSAGHEGLASLATRRAARNRYVG
ncbi:MAG: hypothetical protein ACYDC2_00235, partial [Solirubrobacteraceae bacterium]